MSKQTAEIDIQLNNGQSAGKTINELTAQSAKLAREIKKMEVGSEEFVQASEDFKKISGRLKEIKTEAFATEKAQSMLNSTVGEMIPFNKQLGGIVTSFKGMSSAIKATTLSQRALNIAIAASGIGLLVMILVKLIQAFLDTQAGMDKVTAVTRPLFAIFERLKGLAQELGGTVFKGLAMILKGDVAEGLKVLGGGVKDAVMGLGDAVKEGAAAGTEIDKLTKQIEKTQNDMILTQSRLNRQIAEQKELAKDSTKTEQERQAAAQKAIELINQRTAEEDKLLQLQIKKMQIEQSLNDTDRRGEAEMNQLIAQREQLLADAAKERSMLNNKANKEEIEGTKQVSKAKTEAVDNDIKEQERYAKMVMDADKKLADLRISMIPDETERKEAQIRLAAEREIKAFEGTEEQITAFKLIKEQERDAAIQALKDEQTKKANAKALADLDTQNQIEQEYIKELFYTNLLSKEEMEEQIFQLQVEAIEKRLALLAAAGETEVSQYQKLYTELAKLNYDHEQKKFEDAERFEEAKRSLMDQGYQAAREVFGSFQQLLSQDEAAKRKNFNVLKALKAAEIKASFVNELAGIWENANKNPLNAVFPGSANLIAGVKTVAAAARYQTGMMSLFSSKFEKGGPVFGPSHQAGGIGFGVKGSGVRHEMEGDEIILSKGVFRNPMLRSIASDLNVAGGGRSFAMGGPVVDRPMQRMDSSEIRNTVTQASGASTGDMNRTNSILEQIEANTRITAQKPVLSTRQIREELTDLNQLENDARF